MQKIAKAYERVGDRGPSHIYWSGGTVPGLANHIYMDWYAEKIESPFRADVKSAPEVSAISKEQLYPNVEETWIEFFQVAPPPQS